MKRTIRWFLEKWSGYHASCICNDGNFDYGYINGEIVFFYKGIGYVAEFKTKDFK